ncbi:hypothetical protein MJD09_25285, partial [bacterium]|nr:hypothetical protein [bacterium]
KIMDISDFLATLGSNTSMLGLALAACIARIDRGKLRVETSPVDHQDQIGKVERKLHCALINEGRRPIMAYSFALEYSPGGSMRAMPSFQDKLPKMLVPYEWISFTMPGPSEESELRKVWGKDTLGKKYYLKRSLLHRAREILEKPPAAR